MEPRLTEPDSMSQINCLLQKKQCRHHVRHKEACCLSPVCFAQWMYQIQKLRRFAAGCSEPRPTLRVRGYHSQSYHLDNDLREMPLFVNPLIRLFNLIHRKNPLVDDRLDILLLDKPHHFLELILRPQDNTSYRAHSPQSIHHTRHLFCFASEHSSDGHGSLDTDGFHGLGNS